jgi:hypothetical protein
MMTLAQAKKGFKEIVRARHQRQGTSPDLDLQLLDDVKSPPVLWRALELIVPPPPPLVCCRYTIDGHEFRSNMAEADWDLVPDPDKSFTKGPCGS